MARKHSPRIPKERFRPAQAAAVVLNQKCQCAGKFVQGLCGAGNQTDRKFKFILFYFPSQGLDRGKNMYFKASDLCLVNTT
jgi:hypothetical protein